MAEVAGAGAGAGGFWDRVEAALRGIGIVYDEKAYLKALCPSLAVSLALTRALLSPALVSPSLSPARPLACLVACFRSRPCGSTRLSRFLATPTPPPSRSTDLSTPAARPARVPKGGSMAG